MQQTNSNSNSDSDLIPNTNSNTISNSNNKINQQHLSQIITTALNGLGFNLVDLELSARGKLIRVFMENADLVSEINTQHCADVSNHLVRLFEVENIDFERLEISSPGLDRVLKSLADFVRFVGKDVQLKTRIPVENQRNFRGNIKNVDSEKNLIILDLDATKINDEKEKGKGKEKGKDRNKNKNKNAKKNNQNLVEDIDNKNYVEINFNNIDKARLIPRIEF